MSRESILLPRAYAGCPSTLITRGRMAPVPDRIWGEATLCTCVNHFVHFPSQRWGGSVHRSRLSGIDVARVVKKLAVRAGLDAAKYAGHSLRAGHATSAAIAGASERSIMKQTGHRSVQMVRRYIRDGNLFRENSAGKLGL